MAYSLIWLPDVLQAASLPFTLEPGWDTRGHGDMGNVLGVMCHDTASNMATPDAADVNLVINGRPDLAGPLAQLVLSRGGIFHVIAAGKCWHAGLPDANGPWHWLAGNSHMIGIEAENSGRADDLWPAVQLDAYAKGCAAILQHVGAKASMCIAHREYAPSRKQDVPFDMSVFRVAVASHMNLTTNDPVGT